MLSLKSFVKCVINSFDCPVSYRVCCPFCGFILHITLSWFRALRSLFHLLSLCSISSSTPELSPNFCPLFLSIFVVLRIIGSLFAWSIICIPHTCCFNQLVKLFRKKKSTWALSVESIDENYHGTWNGIYGSTVASLWWVLI